jgi:hypothetical protein
MRTWRLVKFAKRFVKRVATCYDQESSVLSILSNETLIRCYLLLDLLKLDYWHSLPRTLIGTNRHVKQNVIHVLGNPFVVWQKVKCTFYSFKLNSDSMLFSPGYVKARLLIELTSDFNRNESPRETKRCYSRSENAIYAMLKSKAPYVFFQIKLWFDNIYSWTC